ncbi:hypothetical protein L6164_033229 [Bauhinia variegata]|uniref:Uncharacterized protein n=1 Tax=Bauhinia variegata TaxID=167791 RepID=A0ACB9KRC1_BAUVA|nr:hypothetical protein L6164_033229 [Bauhinia variegata]
MSIHISGAAPAAAFLRGKLGIKIPAQRHRISPNPANGFVDDMKGEYWSVGVGGPQDHQGYLTLTGYFKIHKLGSFAYRFSFLPLVNAPTSGYIGKTRDKDGNIRIVVTGEESFYGVVFIKAASEVSKL